MHVKTTRSAESGSKGIKGSAKTYILSKFHKATVYAAHLVSLLKEQAVAKSNSEDILEARAYYIGLHGAANFEKRNWERALQQYSEARLIYTTLAASKSSAREDLFRDLLSSTVDPSIRYAAYQLKIPRTVSLDSVVARYVPQDDNEYVHEILKRNPEALDDPAGKGKKDGDGKVGKEPQTIKWRSRTVNIEDSSTAQALGAVSDAEAQLVSFLSSNEHAAPQTKAAAYDQVLIPSQDAVDATKTAIDELSAEGVSQGDRRMQALQVTKTAVNYALVGWRIGRNRILCGSEDGALLEKGSAGAPKASNENDEPKSAQDESIGHKIRKLKERAVLYDASLQSLDAVKELPGVAADEDFLEQVQVKRDYFSALRCLALARSHALMQHNKEALALVSRASDLSTTVSCHSSLARSISSQPLNIDVTASQAKFLDGLLKSLVLHYRALVELHDINTASIAAAIKNIVLPPLIERLDEYPAGGIDLTKLVNYPPTVETVPVKPLFLDLAYNYIEYPGKTQKAVGKDVNGTAGLGENKEERKDGKKGGWFTFGR